MQLVLDASAVLQLASSPQGFAHLGDHDLVAPPLMWSGAIAVLHESQWRGDISASLALETRARILTAPVRAHIGMQPLVDAWQIADQLGWAKTYDAEYVALARRLGCRLLTLDNRLRRGVDRLVESIGPSEL